MLRWCARFNISAIVFVRKYTHRCLSQIAVNVIFNKQITYKLLHSNKKHLCASQNDCCCDAHSSDMQRNGFFLSKAFVTFLSNEIPESISVTYIERYSALICLAAVSLNLEAEDSSCFALCFDHSGSNSVQKSSCGAVDNFKNERGKKESKVCTGGNKAQRIFPSAVHTQHGI